MTPNRARSKTRQRAAAVVHQSLRHLGVDVVRIRHLGDFATRRALTLRDIDVVVDVGANCGQYGRLVRESGFKGRIVSFEPLEKPFRELERACQHDVNWECFRFALSDHSGPRMMMISANIASSSLLHLTADTIDSAPELRPVARVEVETRTLDEVASEHWSEKDRIFLKLDVQGSELDLLRFARQTLTAVTAMEIELTVLPLYDGQALISDVAGHLAQHGYRLAAVEDGYRDLRTGRLEQLEGLFLRL